MSTIASRIPDTFRALRSRNYRLFFVGQTLSLIGTWMTRVATSWLIYRLTHSALLLGTLGFASQIPVFVMSPFAGVLVDRWDRYRIMVTTQTLSMIQSFALAGLALAHVITVEEVIALGIFQGFINSFDTPARQSFMVRMVDDRADLSNAIALNSSMVNSARLIGPSIAGILIATVGEGWCFFVDGVSYVAVIISLLMMRIDPATAPRRSGSGSAVDELREGWAYVRGFRSVANLLLLLALISLVGMPYTVLIPIVASERLRGGPQLFGLLMSSIGVGALVGAVSLAARKSVVGLGVVVTRAIAIFGTGLIIFAVSRWEWLSVVALGVTGVGFITTLASCNTLIQTVVDDDKRGRVMSFYTMSFMGTAPFGSLLAGTIASRFGAPDTLVAGGVCCLLGAVWFYVGLPAMRRELRPIYRRLGILPEETVPVEADGVAPPPMTGTLVDDDDSRSEGPAGSAEPTD